MKRIIRTDNVMRDNWYELVQAEKNDRMHLVPWESGTKDGCYRTAKGGEYCILEQVNQQGAPIWHHPVSEATARKLMGMPLDKAYDEMGRICAP